MSELEKDNYPYWAPDFNKEFKGFEVWYKGRDAPEGDTADSYRVFMILCNQFYEKTRMEVLQMLKEATEENPIKYQGEFFWSEQI